MVLSLNPMVLPEVDIRDQEKVLAAWLLEIEGHWKNIPEFKVDQQKLQHLVIICDGNRRAAQTKGLHPYLGHRAGVEVIRGIARAGREWGINALTFWTWSTENWQREQEQVDFVMKLAEKFLTEERFLQELLGSGVRFTHLGRKDRLPENLRKALGSLEEKTAKCNQYYLNLAVDYGGLDEIARVTLRMFEAFQKGKFNPEILRQTPQTILGFLDTVGQVLPDLVIRTGCPPGEIPHTSGFMPLQTTYSGWFFLPDLFPNLTPQSLLKPIQDFLGYERRFGR